MKITKRKLLKIMNSAEPTMENCKKTFINGIVVGDLADIWDAMLKIAATGGASVTYVDQQDQAVLDECTERLEQGEARLTRLIDGKSTVSTSTQSITGATTIHAINVDGTDYNLPEGGGSGTLSHYLKTLNISGNTLTFRKVVDGVEEDQSYTPNFDSTYVGISNIQTITGAKNFTGALTQNNDPVVTTSMLSTYATKSELESEASTRETSISTLSGALSTETSNRTAADTTLQNNIDLCEKTANKVSTIAASDTNYPSCNAVIAYINSLNGNDIEY